MTKSYFDSSSQLEFIRRHYDDRMNRSRIRELYGQSDFFNYGYWRAGTRDQAEASQNLVARLLEFIPEKQGTILDVGCGMGATSKYLLRFYRPEEVVGINISGEQLERCRLNAPGCGFTLMDAACLALPDNSFDNLICVESAFHFETRAAFLKEAWRVLKPGGRLVLSDMLFPQWVAEKTSYIPAANYVADVPAYRELYLRTGFQSVAVVDATEECWNGFRRHALRLVWEKTLAGEVEPGTLGKVLLWLLLTLVTQKYLLAAAQKPPTDPADSGRGSRLQGSA